MVGVVLVRVVDAMIGVDVGHALHVVSVVVEAAVEAAAVVVVVAERAWPVEKEYY